MTWFFSCLLFSLVLATLVIVPIARHPTLPRRKKIVIGLVVFLLLVPGLIMLYGWIGVPMMAAL